MDVDEIARGARECLTGQVALLQRRVLELQRENAELRSSLEAAMRVVDGEAEKYADAVKQMR